MSPHSGEVQQIVVVGAFRFVGREYDTKSLRWKVVCGGGAVRIDRAEKPGVFCQSRSFKNEMDRIEGSFRFNCDAAGVFGVESSYRSLRHHFFRRRDEHYDVVGTEARF